jgi:hypothetical protein
MRMSAKRAPTARGYESISGNIRTRRVDCSLGARTWIDDSVFAGVVVLWWQGHAVLQHSTSREACRHRHDMRAPSASR